MKLCGSAHASRNCNSDLRSTPTSPSHYPHPLPYSLTRGHGTAHRIYPTNMNLRKAPASSMQKTYDECYLTCSTAIYFEGQVG
jgi:hypothetical protein